MKRRAGRFIWVGLVLFSRHLRHQQSTRRLGQFEDHVLVGDPESRSYSEGVKAAARAAIRPSGARRAWRRVRRLRPVAPSWTSWARRPPAPDRRLRHGLHRRLAVGGGVADVFLVRRGDGREALLQRGDDVGGVVDGQRGLGDEGEVLAGSRGSKPSHPPPFRSASPRLRAAGPSCRRLPGGRHGRSARSPLPVLWWRWASTWTLETSGQVAST
jgi:hypothetical protein